MRSNSRVEVVYDNQGVTVRRSERGAPYLWFTHAEWNAFLRGVRAGEFDPPASPAWRGAAHRPQELPHRGFRVDR